MAQGSGWNTRFHTYGEALDFGISELKNAKVMDPEVDARWLLEDCCGLRPDFLILKKANQIPEEKYAEYKELIARRVTHEPLQQILGYTEFMGLKFKVTPDVLCPRQDTEILVETVSRIIKDGDRMLDLCTGTGCVLISVLSRGGKNAKADSISGIGADISEAALAVARENAKLNKVTDRSVWLHGDLFAALDQLDPEQRTFDIITANPPYIPSDAINWLMPEVRDHEPHTALDGGHKGLDYYERIVPAARDHLVEGGLLAVEIGYEQGEDVRAIFEVNGYRDIRINKDLSGNDRVVLGTI